VKREGNRHVYHSLVITLRPDESPGHGDGLLEGGVTRIAVKDKLSQIAYARTSMTEEGNSTDFEANRQWTSDRMALAKSEYNHEIQKNAALCQIAGSALTVLSGLAVLKWADKPLTSVSLPHLVAVAALCVLYRVWSENRQKRIDLGEFLGENSKNPDHVAWCRNVAAGYYDAVITMRELRQNNRRLVGLSVSAIVLLAIFGQL
jgi:hypothetical protein